MCLYVCMCVCGAFMHVCMRGLAGCVCGVMSVRMYVCMRACMYVVCGCTYVCMYVCMCVG